VTSATQARAQKLLERLRARRVTVAGRLALVFCALVVFSTVFTLGLQDRGLMRGLEQAARQRLDRAAGVADQLLHEHLRSVAQRYVAVSRTPEMRANLEVGHSDTLAYFADWLRKDHGAALVSFQGPDGSPVARSGAEALASGIPSALRTLGELDTLACVEVDDRLRRAPSAGPPAYRACRDLEGRVQATPMVVGEAAYAVVSIPLTTGSRRAGHLLVAEAIGSDLLDAWSGLSGADVRLDAADPGDDADLVQVAARFPSAALWISSSLTTERLAMQRARQNLLFSGLLALAAALFASLGLARSLARPLRAMQEATERIRRGDLATRLHMQRNDELGDLSDAFDSMLDRLDETGSRLRRVQQLARFGEWSLRFDTGKVEGSREFQRALGIPGDSTIELLLAELLDRIHPEDRGALRREVERCREADLSFELQVRAPRGADNRILLFRGRSRVGDDGIARLEGSVEDLTERNAAEEQVRYLTYHNPVTGLPNTRFFRERLLHACRRAREKPFAVLLVGLDHFQLLNETHGHSFGDAVLRGTASRLLESLTSEDRSSSSGRAVAHLGGDEFALLLEEVSTPADADPLTQRLLERIAQPHVVQGREVIVSASIGVCFGGAASQPSAPETLLSHCDSSLRRAKEAGRSRVAFFDERARAETSQRLRIDTRLRRALAEGRLELHYQPRITASTESVACFEALLRWNDEELGSVPPSEFIPIAEQSGLIQSLGSWALVEALSHVRCWREAGYAQAKVSINLSPQQFHRDIDVEIQDLLGGLDPECIELEVTEYGLLRDEGAAIGALRRLRDAGFRVSLDDFGTGYSSLNYLRKLPLDAIKIDRSFVSPMDRDPDAAALIGSIIAMLRVLRLDIIAEGVETAEQRDMLVEMGCDELQGFFYSPAVASDVALQMLATPREKKAKTSARAQRSRKATKPRRRRS
jgi:diguanylate cyclase (GGDEF)-like protein